MKDRDDLENLSGAYALNALDKEERAEFEARLEESEETRNEVTELTDTAVMLGLAVAPVEPSAELKANIMSRLASTPQLPRQGNPPRQPDAEQPDAEAPVTPATLKAQSRWYRKPLAAILAAAAAIVLIVGGGVVIANITTANKVQIAQADQLAAITAASDHMQSVAELDGGGKATLVWSAGLASSAIIVDGLRGLPSDKTYQLWYMDTTGGARAAGTLHATGHGEIWQVLDGKMKAGDTIGVTVEPRSGSKAPTTDPIVTFETA